jgi:hypothetical protein
MNSIEKITEESLLKKVADGVSRKSVWTKPMLLLTKNGDDYLYISDTLNEIYPKSKCINVDPSYYRFDVVDGEQVLVLLTGDEEAIIDGHRPELELYKNLGGYLGYVVYYWMGRFYEKLPKVFKSELSLNIVAAIILIGVISLL